MTNPDSMVERVARALCSEDPDRVGPISCDDGRRVVSGKPAWTAWEEDARTAIVAMREPTDGMIEAGDRRAYPFIASGDDCTETIVYEAWLGMIDEALK